MDTNRRDFLRNALWMGTAAATIGLARGQTCSGGSCSDGGSMLGWADKPFKTLRVGVVGLGRGSLGLDLGKIPGVTITAICDITQARVDRALKRCADRKIPTPKVFTGSPEAWKKMCEWDQVDLVYNGTPWQLHTPIALYAMEHGKHVVTEVPSALTIEQCWALVETSERTRRHCMQLENCCYGETEMLALNMCRLGLFGTLVHGEGAYIHDLRTSCYGKFDPATGSGGYWDYWRLRYNRAHGGNQYPTHGLGPICIDMDINRGDNFDYLVSVDSMQAGFQEYGKGKFGAGSPEAGWKVKMGDMNTTIIKTKLGRTIMVQHNVTGPRPYSRINLISGTPPGLSAPHRPRDRARQGRARLRRQGHRRAPREVQASAVEDRRRVRQGPRRARRHGLPHAPAPRLVPPDGPAARHERLRPRRLVLAERAHGEVGRQPRPHDGRPRLHARRVEDAEALRLRRRRPRQDGPEPQGRLNGPRQNSLESQTRLSMM